jgi:YggT family protein
MGANPENVFAHTIYNLSSTILQPFINLVVNPTGAGIELEVTSLIAMLVYGLLGWILVSLVRLIFMPTRSRIVSTVNKERQR